MKIYSVAVNIHDHNTYNGVFHNQVERHLRRKHNLNPSNPHDPEPSRDFFREHFIPKFKDRTDDEIFAFTCSNLGQQFVKNLLEETVGNLDFLNFKPKNLWDYKQTNDYYYIDHHQSHAAYAFLSSGYEESDILAIDGRGWHFNCIFVDKDGKITNLSDKISIGGLWNRLAQDLGFGYLGAGKVMGLAGYGKYCYQVDAIIEYYLHNPYHKLPEFAKKVLPNVSKEDIAYTLQHATIELIKKYVYPLKTCNNICIGGGVAYNGYMNEEFTKHYKNVHVPPAVGDEGQALGTYMHAEYVLNNRTHVPNVYAGKLHTQLHKSLFEGLTYEVVPFDQLVVRVAQAIADGKIVGWYQGKSESGNRALGNRSILADPRNPDIKDIINSKIKLREDFRPFAPSVLEEHYQDYFDTNQPSPYMSRIMPVTSDAIPGVTHVDGTARIQTVTRDVNIRYYTLIEEFYKITGIPMLLNTSFNCQEPIVETPEDAINTFKKCGLDILVVGDILIRKCDD
jgi:carbamoyltransferase